MDSSTPQIIAGSLSTLLFIIANVPMLMKAYKTRNLRSYSFSNIALVNVGNLLHWLYISNLPTGPIWLLHGFYTIASVLMLVWYLRYEHAGRKPS
jgi:hypothetical protein